MCNQGNPQLDPVVVITSNSQASIQEETNAIINKLIVCNAKQKLKQV
jgi:hypothetical protein